MPLATNARLSSVTWSSVWQNWRKRINHYEQAWASLSSHRLITTIRQSREGVGTGLREQRAQGEDQESRERVVGCHQSVADLGSPAQHSSPTAGLHRLSSSPSHLIRWLSSHTCTLISTAYPLSPVTSTSSLSSSNIFDEFESTRHLARVATVESGAQFTPTSLQRVDSQRIIISPNSTSLLHPQRR